MNEENTETKPDNAATPDSVGRVVRLLKCGKQRCSHVFTDDEYVDIPHPEWANSSIRTCPKCGNDSVWMLDKNGRVVDLGRSDGIDPGDIEPSPRMGLKMKRRILAAKRRALV